MLRSLRSLTGFHVQAVDGEAGRVFNFYFDDHVWNIRYLVVETGGWLSRRKVLVDPKQLGDPVFKARVLPVALSLDQLSHCPEADTQQPVSRQEEVGMAAHFGWPSYSPMEPMMPGASSTLRPPMETQEPEPGSPYLRSMREVLHYELECPDGRLGRLKDLIVNDKIWQISQLVAELAGVHGGGKVLLPPKWVQRISWSHRRVAIAMESAVAAGAPRYNPRAPVNRRYEELTYDYHGRRVP